MISWPPGLGAWWFYPGLFLTALFAGTADTIAGGGGLITVPVLMSMGWSPQDALGTNKFQSSFGSGSATLHFVRAGAVSLRECLQGILWTALGAGAGAWAVDEMSPEALKVIIPPLLILIALYAAFTPRLGMEARAPKMRQGAFYLLFGLGIGFYDGVFGPGTGSFWAVAFVLLLGFEMVHATAATKVMNNTSNVVSLAVFLAMGHVRFVPGLVMAAGQYLGGMLGARLVMTRGARLVRPVLITVALAIAGRLLWQQFF